jgi:pyruvate,orthophosphate dikinase
VTLKYVYDFTEGDRGMVDLLGGKGANLSEMTRLGLPVPPGFTITTEACREYLRTGSEPETLYPQVWTNLAAVEGRSRRYFGDASDPLLVSVRSGARFSMPGMMDTVLNIGLNDDTLVGLARVTNNERFAWDSYRRLIQMFGKTVLDIEGHLFEEILDGLKKARGVSTDVELTVTDLQELVAEFKALVLRETGEAFPQDVKQQLILAVKAVFRSWNTERAQLYRRQERIADDLGTAVNVCTMVFGNRGETSGTGVAFTRDPATGAPGEYGDWLPNAQGEDVVAGIRNTMKLADMRTTLPEIHDQLIAIMGQLEQHYRDLCDIEFTVEEGKLWMLQTRVGKRTPAAAFRIAAGFATEGKISLDEALQRVSGKQLINLMFPRFVGNHDANRIAVGISAAPGAAVGKAAFSSARAVELAELGEKVILVRRETNPDDLSGMVASVGILTSRGGKTSHAAVVARGMGKTAVCGADTLLVEHDKATAQDGTVIREGDVIAIDGSTGEVFVGDVPVTESNVTRYFDGSLTDAERQADPLVVAVDLLATHADLKRRLGVRANADTPEDAALARKMGAAGIGLVRTEHMFLGDRRGLVEDLILAENDEQKDKALAALLPLQVQDFVGILRAMDGLPVVIRLIDPPLHEFLPNKEGLAIKLAVAQATGKKVAASDEKLLAALERMHEANPMLGLRGVRLGIVFKGLFEMQIRAIVEASAILKKEGLAPHAEIMVPLVASIKEFEPVKFAAKQITAEANKRHSVNLDIPVGTMIELPRAAVTADRIAREAEFFSFGTNDLTQTTWGFSRDDVEASFVGEYLERGILGTSPFETIDAIGVGELMKIAIAKGREVNPNLTLGACGEHGGDPVSIDYFESIGLDYVSCSPYRVPVARLEAGRAALVETGSSDSR